MNDAAMNVHEQSLQGHVFSFPLGRYLGVLLLSQVVSHLSFTSLPSTHPISVFFFFSFIAMICFSLFLHIYLPLLGYGDHYSKQQGSTISLASTTAVVGLVGPHKFAKI